MALLLEMTQFTSLIQASMMAPLGLHYYEAPLQLHTDSSDRYYWWKIPNLSNSPWSHSLQVSFCQSWACFDRLSHRRFSSCYTNLRIQYS